MKEGIYLNQGVLEVLGGVFVKGLLKARRAATPVRGCLGLFRGHWV